MNKQALGIIIYNIIVVLSIMYATQPLQPILAEEFHVSMTQSSLFTAIILLCLAIAPIFYGYILESISAKKMLIVASIILFFTNLVLAFSSSYEMFLFMRLCEGLVVPAILTSSMSILANIDKNNVQFNMSVYVASTVFGGLIGRVLSGFIASEFGWRAVFFSLSFALFISLLFIWNLKLDISSKMNKPKLKDILLILKDKRFALIYLTMFTVFFVFAGLLNLLPFRMKDLFPNMNESSIGLLYLGYGSGVIVALFSRKIILFFKSSIRTVLAGGVFFTLISIFFISSNHTVIFILMFLLCIGMFTIHTVASGMANSILEKQKGLTSGMYLSFYYIGGALGSSLPTLIYKYYGWNTVILIFILCLLFIFTVLYRNRAIFNK
ncbi:MAG: MFS transporter [Campylobacteraceae bacterium]|nr:MFS transporter [Campylobacteraceae bacterium]